MTHPNRRTRINRTGADPPKGLDSIQSSQGNALSTSCIHTISTCRTPQDNNNERTNGKSIDPYSTNCHCYLSLLTETNDVKPGNSFRAGQIDSNLFHLRCFFSLFEKSFPLTDTPRWIEQHQTNRTPIRRLSHTNHNHFYARPLS